MRFGNGRSGAVWVSLAVISIALFATNPNEEAAKYWLIDKVREQVGRPAVGDSSVQSILQSAASAAVPDLIDESVQMRRKNFLILSVYSAMPRGMLAFGLEYSGRVELAREGVCIVGVAGIFFFCKEPAL